MVIVRAILTTPTEQDTVSDRGMVIGKALDVSPDGLVHVGSGIERTSIELADIVDQHIKYGAQNGRDLFKPNDREYQTELQLYREQTNREPTMHQVAVGDVTLHAYDLTISE